MKITDSKHRISELLSVMGISQTEFCKKTGLQKSALSNYLNGDREPRQNQLSKIADAYNINPAWLMGYDVPMNYELEVFDNPAEFERKWNTLGGGRHPISLSDTEYSIIINFRASDPVTQSNILKLLNIEKKDADILNA